MPLLYSYIRSKSFYLHVMHAYYGHTVCFKRNCIPHQQSLKPYSTYLFNFSNLNILPSSSLSSKGRSVNAPKIRTCYTFTTTLFYNLHSIQFQFREFRSIPNWSNFLNEQQNSLLDWLIVTIIVVHIVWFLKSLTLHCHKQFFFSFPNILLQRYNHHTIVLMAYTFFY